jgi:hypothetical protein
LPGGQLLTTSKSRTRRGDRPYMSMPIAATVEPTETPPSAWLSMVSASSVPPAPASSEISVEVPGRLPPSVSSSSRL